MEIIKKWLLYAGLDKNDFHILLPQAWNENKGKLKIYSLVSLFVFFCLAAASFIFDIFSEQSSVVYCAMMVFSAAFYFVTLFIAKNRPRLTAILCFLFVAVLYAFSIINSVIYYELPAITAIAILLLGPFLFTERPIHLIGMNIAETVILCVISYRIKTYETANVDACNALVFGFLSVVAEIMQESIRFRLLHQTNQIKYLSETDLLTGCKNRNCYQNRISSFPEQCKKGLICVYVDVNGLHNLNDEKGHDAGDSMLKTVARVLLDTFGTEHTYRVGGDEFVVIRMDISMEETRQSMAHISATLSSQGCDVSIGAAFAEKPMIDMADLVSRAEQEMYHSKNNYYDQAGHERRRQ